jgi:hypothetical protein
LAVKGVLVLPQHGMRGASRAILFRKLSLPGDLSRSSKIPFRNGRFLLRIGFARLSVVYLSFWEI